MKLIVCNLPEFLIEKNLKKTFHINSKINRKKKVSFTSLKIDGTEWDPTDLKSNKVFFNWEKVKYFDNSGILTLLTAQYYLLELGISITNFNESAKIGCNKFVKRALDSFGYFSQLLSGRFQLPTSEKYFISNINYIESIPSLKEYSEILPIISCKTQTSILKGSSEDKVIKEYEDNMSIRMFIHQDKNVIKRRKIIENGEFGHLIIRQCRKNVIEHSKSDIAFSCAQIRRKRDIELSWGLSYEEIKGKTDKNLETIFENYPDDMPILDLTTIDNGIGIPETLNDTWESIILYGEKKIEAKSRVNKLTPDWSTNEKLITFAMDSEGSCKIDLDRSHESPGLYKIKDLVHTENGFLEISSNSAKILYTKNKKWERSEHNNSFNHGTLVRILIPLVEITPTETEKIRNNITKEKLDHLHLEAPQEIINLHYWWIKIKKTSDNIKEAIKYFVNLIIFEVRRIAEKQQVKTILLNWENLPWTDHYISNFFDELRLNLLEDRKLKPIIHINVPKEYLLLGEVAISKYRESLSLITLVVFEGNSSWTWIGIPKIANEFSGSNTSIGKELDKILTNNRPFSIRTLGTRSRDLIRQCLNECSLFKEQKGTDKDGSIKFLGSYEFFPVYIPLARHKHEIYQLNTCEELVIFLNEKIVEYTFPILSNFINQNSRELLEWLNINCTEFQGYFFEDRIKRILRDGINEYIFSLKKEMDGNRRALNSKREKVEPKYISFIFHSLRFYMAKYVRVVLIIDDVDTLVKKSSYNFCIYRLLGPVFFVAMIYTGDKTGLLKKIVSIISGWGS